MKIKRTLVYIAPQLTIIELKQGAFILAGSPPVRPGGDGKEPNKGVSRKTQLQLLPSCT